MRRIIRRIGGRREMVVIEGSKCVGNDDCDG